MHSARSRYPFNDQPAENVDSEVRFMRCAASSLLAPVAVATICVHRLAPGLADRTATPVVITAPFCTRTAVSASVVARQDRLMPQV